MYEKEQALAFFERAIRGKKTEEFIRTMESTQGFPLFTHALESLLIARGTEDMIKCYIWHKKLFEANEDFLRCKYPNIYRWEYKWK